MSTKDYRLSCRLSSERFRSRQYNHQKSQYYAPLLGNIISRFLLRVSCIFEISVDICTKGLVAQKLTWYGESLREPYTRSIFSTNFHSWLSVYRLKKFCLDNGVHIFPLFLNSSVHFFYNKPVYPIWHYSFLNFAYFLALKVS